MTTENTQAYISIDRSNYVHAPLWWHERGLSQTASGYGRKLTSPYKVPYGGRLYRVYVTQYGNAGTAYIVVKGERIIIR